MKTIDTQGRMSNATIVCLFCCGHSYIVKLVIGTNQTSIRQYEREVREKWAKECVVGIGKVLLQLQVVAWVGQVAPIETKNGEGLTREVDVLDLVGAPRDYQTQLESGSAVR